MSARYRRRALVGFVLVIAVVVAVVLLSEGGGQRSTLPPRPSGANGFVPLARLARFPEVYAGAQVNTIGRVRDLGGEELELTAPGVHTRVSIYPASLALPLRGRLVRASGTFSVTFQTGYELQLAAIATVGN
jgi:hypothetical protein